MPVAWRLHRFGQIRNTSLVQLRMELEIRDLEMRKTVSGTDGEDTVIETFTQDILYNCQYTETQNVAGVENTLYFHYLAVSAYRDASS